MRTYVRGRQRGRPSFTRTPTHSSRRSSSATTLRCAASRLVSWQGRGDGRELRGAPPRDPRRHERPPRAPALPRPGRRLAPLRRLRRGQPRALRGLSPMRAGGRGPLDGGGVPRRDRARANPRLATRRSRRACATRHASEVGLRGHGRRRADEDAWRRWRAGRRSRMACLIVPRDGERAFIEPLPVESLWGVGPATARALHELGVRTVGEIAVDARIRARDRRRQPRRPIT